MKPASGRLFAPLVALALGVSCATSEDPARAVPEPAAPVTDGWLEIYLNDSRVPADPIEEAAGHGARPPTCELEVDLDGTPVLSEQIVPNGATPPYSVDSTFRVTSAPGSYSATLYYSSCRRYGKQLDSLEATLPITIRRGKVTHMRYNGSSVRAFPPTHPDLEPVW